MNEFLRQVEQRGVSRLDSCSASHPVEDPETFLAETRALVYPRPFGSVTEQTYPVLAGCSFMLLC